MELPHTQRSTPAPEESAGGCAGAPGGRKGTAGTPGHPPPRQRRHGQAPAGPSDSTTRRNERERNRVKLVNLGFANLQRHVPPRGPSKRMSKVDTLRSAVEYIQGLEVLLREVGPGASEGSPSSAADRGSLSDSPLSSYSSEDASRDSEREFTSYKDWLGIE